MARSNPKKETINPRPQRRAGLRPDERDPDESARKPGSAGGEKNMAGTPGGGLAAGGLAGTNAPSGSVEDVVDDLNDAMGEGTADISGLEEIAGEDAYSGPAGGAVGGTPAGKRTRGGNLRPATENVPANSSGRESTIGGNPAKAQQKKKSPDKPRRSGGVRKDKSP